MVGHELYNKFPSNTGVFVSALKLQGALTAHRIKLEKKSRIHGSGRDKLYRQLIEDARPQELAKKAIVSDVFASLLKQLRCTGTYR